MQKQLEKDKGSNAALRLGAGLLLGIAALFCMKNAGWQIDLRSFLGFILFSPIALGAFWAIVPSSGLKTTRSVAIASCILIASGLVINVTLGISSSAWLSLATAMVVLGCMAFSICTTAIAIAEFFRRTFKDALRR